MLIANMKTSNLYVKSLKLHNFSVLYCSYMHVYFVLANTVEMLHKTNSTVFFISPPTVPVFYKHSAFSSLMDKEGPKGKGLRDPLPFPAALCHCLPLKLLANTGN